MAKVDISSNFQIPRIWYGNSKVLDFLENHKCIDKNESNEFQMKILKEQLCRNIRYFIITVEYVDGNLFVNSGYSKQ